jgi:histone acetyltransferase (RNA polymerase elongator complex component)
MVQYVTKCRHIKFRSRGITQKKEYNFQNTAKVLKEEYVYLSGQFVFQTTFEPGTSRMKDRNVTDCAILLVSY